MASQTTAEQVVSLNTGYLLKRFTLARPIEIEPDSAAGQVPHLTAREREVLELVARGCTNSDIAKLLEMSLHTVHSHMKSIFRKLCVRSRGEAVFEATQLRIIELGIR